MRSMPNNKNYDKMYGQVFGRKTKACGCQDTVGYRFAAKKVPHGYRAECKDFPHLYVEGPEPYLVIEQLRKLVEAELEERARREVA